MGHPVKLVVLTVSLLDDDRRLHIVMALAAEDVAIYGVAARHIGTERDVRGPAGIDRLGYVKATNVESVLDVGCRDVQVHQCPFAYTDLVREDLPLLHHDRDGEFRGGRGKLVAPERHQGKD